MAGESGEGSSSKKKTTTGSVSRAMFGVGSVIDTHHEGGLKSRRVENALDRRLDRQTEVLAGAGDSQGEDRGQVIWSEEHGGRVRVKDGRIVEILKREKPL